MWTRSELKSAAKVTFKNNYWPCILIAFILMVCEGSSSVNFNFGGGAHDSSSSFDGISNMDWSQLTAIFAILAIVLVIFLVVFAIILALQIFLGNIFVVGGRRFYIENQMKKASINNIMFSFSKGRYINTLVTMLLKKVFVFLWSLLLIIPGIIKSYSYFMVDYIIAENPSIDHKRAFEISKQTMNGQKWKTFVLDLSFIGWYILSLFTCLILCIFYVNPYVHSTKAQLYLTLRKMALENGIATNEELCGIQA